MLIHKLDFKNTIYLFKFFYFIIKYLYDILRLHNLFTELRSPQKVSVSVTAAVVVLP